MDLQNSISTKKSNILSKINWLSPDNRKKFDEKLLGILEFNDLAIRYGIKKEDFSTLPEDQVQTVKEKLYREMFGKNYKRRPAYVI
jgi:hypothetical protein